MEERVTAKERERTKARSLLLQVETALSDAVEERERCDEGETRGGEEGREGEGAGS